MTRGKLFLLLLVALGVALYVEQSRAVILDLVSPAAQPALRWVTQQELNQIAEDLETHLASGGQIPSARGAFERWLRERYRDDRFHQDAWETPYQLRVQGNRFEVVSAGTDRTFGTEDDLVAGGSRQGGASPR